MVSKIKVYLLLGLYFAFFLFGAALIWPSASLGQVLGVWSLTALTFQLILASRSKILEERVGLPVIMRFHSFNGKLLFFTVTLHPVLVFGGIPTFATFSIYYWLGVAAFVLIILTLVTTLFVKLNYEFWKVLHKVGYVIAVLGFAHSFFSGSHIYKGSPLYYWWMFLFALALTAFIVRRINLRAGHEYVVTRVVGETPDVVSVYMKPVAGKIFDYAPGQFAYVTFHSKALPLEEHHFTLSSSPGGNEISMTIKNLGDFTALVPNLKPGDKATVSLPYGVFSNASDPGPTLFVAGGVGITPIMSMLRFLGKNKIKKDVVLVFSVKTKNDVVFGKEIKKLGVKTIFRFTQTDGPLDEKVFENVSELSRRSAYVCGPEGMINATTKVLRGLGIPKNKIYSEKFALR